MTLLKKALYGVAFIATGLLSTAIFAQADQASDTAVDAAARGQAKVETDARAIKDGDEIATNKATITREAGAAASVDMPKSGSAKAETANRGVAAESRSRQPNPLDSANSLTGNDQ